MDLIKYEQEKHYELICFWWNKHMGKPIPPGMLSDEGWIACSHGKPVVASWLYTGNSSLAFMGFPVSDPESKIKDRAVGLILLVRRMKKIAQLKGFRYLFGMSSNSAYSRIMRKEGFNDYKQHEVFLFENASSTVFGRKRPGDSGSVDRGLGDSN